MAKKLKKKKVVSKRIVKKTVKKRTVKKAVVRKSKTIKRTAFKPTIKPKIVLKAAKAPAKKLLGKVVHFYPHISVAVVEVAATIKQGDKVHLARHEDSFQQRVNSMQIDYTKITEAKKRPGHRHESGQARERRNFGLCGLNEKFITTRGYIIILLQKEVKMECEIVVFDDSSKQRILNALGLEINEESQIVNKSNNKVITTTEHEPIKVDQFGGILKGSKIPITKDKIELVRYFIGESK